MKKCLVLNKIIMLVILFLFNSTLFAQEIIKTIYVGDSGVVDEIKEATALILIKEYPGDIYERLDYQAGAPLLKLRTYNDSNLSNLEGKYFKYHESGMVAINGQYSQNKKSGEWLYYDDKGKIVNKEVYDKDALISTEIADTLKEKELNKHEKEAEFLTGKKEWLKYLQASLMRTDIETAMLKGQVLVMYTVDIEGKLKEIYLKKSARYELDEESLKIIRRSSLWEPAIQKGNKVNSLLIQPFTFRGED